MKLIPSTQPIIKKLGLPIKSINVKVQKIVDATLDTYEIVVIAFLLTNKTNELKFIEKTFMMANICLEVVFGMFFLILSDANVKFLD